ncbi:MAG: ABC transporter ATP-binding protein/permease [Bacteroidota bacterium]|nr:ABC transporter ATP-binding protein/permease [Bacteroidota bacterium]
MKHLKHLFRYFWKYRFRLGIGIIFIIISNYFGVLAPQVTGFIIDYVQRSLQLPGYKPKSEPANYDILVQKFIATLETMQLSVSDIVAISGITILVLALLRGLFMFFMRQTIIVMSRHIEYDQKNEVYEHYQKLDAGFYKSTSTGDLMSRISEDVSKVRMFTGPAIMYLINLIALISLTIFFMYRRSPDLTFYVLTPLPVLAITIYLVNNIIHKKSEALQATLASLTTNAQQSYSGIRVIKSFVQEKAMLYYFKENSEKYRKDAVTLARIESLYFPSMSFFIGLSTLLTIMIGGIQYINQDNNIGLDVIVEFVIYINMLTFPVSAIGWTASMIQRAAASQKRLNEFLHTKPKIFNEENTTPFVLEGDVHFDSVNFTYPNTGLHALKNFTLHIKAGEKVAIVGRTGSGKSTMAQLLLRMYEPDNGRIFFDGRESRTILLDALRSQISYVPQDGFLFSDSIASNISFGLNTHDQAEIEKAAKTAAIHNEIVSFPKGYETLVGERGVTLSGGQKQRISIARAIIKKTPVLLLDDTLSAVDTRTENKILTQVKEYMRNRTAIVITHKIAGITSFDKIVVLEEGKIVEMGTHEQLFDKKGLYYEMYQRQQLQESKSI